MLKPYNLTFAMIRKILQNATLVGMLALTFGCSPKTENQEETNERVSLDHFPAFFKEGHRGTRGLMPENTIPSMKKAIADGANFIEVDIQISKDKQVLVAHDPHINRDISLLPDGSEIPEEDKFRYALYQMPYDSIRMFDVGSKPVANFPQQKKIKTYIPTFGELIDSVEAFTRKEGYPPVIYNIEVKARPDQDGVLQPAPAELIDLVMEVVNARNLDNRFYVQSFDIRQIQEVRKRYPGVATGFLTGNGKATLEENLERIGFIPEIYSPQFQIATPELVRQVQEKGMKFVPWTVNTVEDMKKLIEMGVDGIITDYPIYFAELEEAGQ